MRNLHVPAAAVNAVLSCAAAAYCALSNCYAHDSKTILKSASHPRFAKASLLKMRSCLDDSKLYVRFCCLPRTRWDLFSLSWVGVNETEKARQSHIAYKSADYHAFRNRVNRLVSRLEF